MADISFIVVNGVKYPVVEGTRVNINGKYYTVDELVNIARKPVQNTEQEASGDIVEPHANNGTPPDVSYVVVNGERYSIDDLQATTELRKLQASVANQYSNSSTYQAGDYCLYDGTLYKCISDISEPEGWNGDHWETVLLTEVSGVSNYNDLQNKPSINDVTLQENTTLQQLGLRGIYYNTKAGWDAQKTLVSEAGAIYIYSDYSTIIVDGETKNVPALKIGDGTSYLIDMPTTNGNIADMLLEHIQNAVVHVTTDDKTFWNNKSSAYIDPNADQETLTLSNTSFMIGGIVYNHG